MATLASRLIQDQNSNVLYNGAALGGKTGVSKADKKGGLGGRKALNDISNSRKASVLQTKKDNSTNIISIGKDLSATKTLSVIGGNSNIPKASEKGKLDGRKALGDLTNSVKPSLQQFSKKGQKLNTVAEENVPVSIVEEGFLHNHQECVIAQREVVDIDYFLKSVGLDNDIPLWPSSPSALAAKSSRPKLESPMKYSEMEEMPEMIFEDQVPQLQKTKIPGYFSPSCRSPNSPKPPYMNWKDENFSDFMLVGTPKLLNP